MRRPVSRNRLKCSVIRLVANVVLFLSVVAVLINGHFLHHHLSETMPLAVEKRTTIKRDRPYERRRTHGVASTTVADRLADRLASRWCPQVRNYTNATTCTLPEADATACDVSTLAVMGVGQASPRGLLINCLKWLLDPAVAEIWLLLPTSALPKLQADTAYGQRLLKWSKMTDHPVHVVWGESLVAAVRMVDQQSESTAMLWHATDHIWPGNQSIVETILTRWREQSAAVWSPQVVGVDQSSPCQPTLTRSATALATAVDIDGFLHHRDYLCGLPDLGTNWTLARQATAVWLSVASPFAMASYEEGPISPAIPNLDDRIQPWLSALPDERMPSAKKCS